MTIGVEEFKIIVEYMLGIIILNYNTYLDTINCVKSIEKSFHDAYRIYIIDNCSIDDSFSKLNEHFVLNKSIKVCLSDKNGGFAYGNNIGFKLAISDGCDKLLCVNSDVVFYENAIQIMRQSLDCGEVAIVGPKIYCADGTMQNTNLNHSTALNFVTSKKGLRWLNKLIYRKSIKKYKTYNYDTPILIDGMVSGCCFMIKAEVLDKINFLDEFTFLYWEEAILDAKIHALGYKIMLNPEAEIIHFGGKSTGKATAFILYNYYRSAMYYFWVYTAISKFGYALLSKFIEFGFFIKSFFNKELIKYRKKLKVELKNIRKVTRFLKK